MALLRSVLSLLALLAVLPSALSLTVHLVPHTHDDVGWLKTVDQYFIGSNRSLQQASVSNLLTAVVAALKRVPERKFIYAEQAFFQRWWRQQSDATKETVRGFVRSGQLEFINGGWCMHDEAGTHYVDMVDQTTLGHQYIRSEFGEHANPTIAWQVDPFGHSATQAALLSAEVGLDALFFGRIDYQDHAWRVREKEMQFSWAPSPSLGPTAAVWSEVALDGNCQADFQYESAERFFINMDKIIKAVNADGRVQAQYSTPSIYYRAKLQENITWSVKTDDFFPYADGATQQITGFYTSRPGKKGYIRSSSILLQAARQLEVFTGGDGSGTEPAWEALGVLQHHDAISGTERQHVNDDYTMRLAAGNAAAYQTLDAALSSLVANASAANAPLQFRSCPLLNISVCPPVAAAKDAYTVALWNPAAHAVVQGVILPLYSATAVEVADGAGRRVQADVVPVARTAATRADSAPYAVHFMAAVEPLGYQTYTIKPSTPASCSEGRYYKRRGGAACAVAAAPAFEAPAAETVQIENSLVSLTFDNATGLLASWTDKASGTSHTLSQSFGYYEAGGSSMYGFEPREGTGFNLATNASATLEVYRSATVQLVVQRWSSWLVQTVRLWANASAPSAEFEWTVGPVSMDGGISREVVTRYTTDVQSGGNFYTDSNGREFLRRRYNARESFNWTVVSPIAANYYPITTAIGLNDSASALYVLVDRAEGGSSQLDGSLELMLHRRILYVCGFDENLNETDSAVYPNEDGTELIRLGEGLIITGRHHLLLGAPEATLEHVRLLQQRLYTPLHPVFTATPSAAGAQSAAVSSLSFLRADSLPANVELMSLHKLFDGRVLLRLSHSFAVGESARYSQPATVDLSALFAQPVRAVAQLTLTGNANYTAVWGGRRGLPYEVEGGLSEAEVERGVRMRKGMEGTTVSLYPMQILTFAVSF